MRCALQQTACFCVSVNEISQIDFSEALSKIVSSNDLPRYPARYAFAHVFKAHFAPACSIRYLLVMFSQKSFIEVSVSFVVDKKPTTPHLYANIKASIFRLFSNCGYMSLNNPFNCFSLLRQDG